MNAFVEKIAIVDPLDRPFGENGNDGSTLEMIQKQINQLKPIHGSKLSTPLDHKELQYVSNKIESSIK